MPFAPYRFQLGAFDCQIVSDGSFAYPTPTQVLFPDAPPSPLHQALRAHHVDPKHWEVYVSPYPSLLIRTDQHRVLVDTGAGDLASTTGHLMTQLHAAGVAAADIDVVILTHGHPDHIGGNLDSVGKPAFPKARYVMARAEWEFWAANPDLASLRVGAFLINLIRACARKIYRPSMTTSISSRMVTRSCRVSMPWSHPDTRLATWCWFWHPKARC